MSKTAILIPARAGSQRIPGKNTCEILSKPLIEYTIETALKLVKPSSVFISSDDRKIEIIAKNFGVEFIKRPDTLATSAAKTIDVVKHFLLVFQSFTEMFTEVMLLQPTVPIRDIEVLQFAIGQIQNEEFDSVNSFLPIDFFHPYKISSLSNGLAKPIMPNRNLNGTNDEFPKYYCRDGSMYCFKPSTVSKYGNIIGENEGYVISDSRFFININEPLDLEIARYLLTKYRNQQQG